MEPNYKHKKLNFYHCDNMDYMATVPDKWFDLAIVDPPYGLNMAKERPRKDGRFANNIPKKWDEKTPDKEYFEELFRVSKNQIIWGANYFNLPVHQCFIFWYKKNPVSNFSDGELAWTSFKKPAVCFDYRYFGNIEGKKNASEKIHISQKPEALYDWLLKNYAKPNDRILDTHLGSMSIALAINKANELLKTNYEFHGCEIDKDYFEAGIKRFKQDAIKNVIEFPEPEVLTQNKLNL